MKSYFKKKQGFTLIELLVVLVIMSLITLVFLNNQSKFDSSTIMRSLAYSIALSVRQAQVYGISVQQSSTGAAGNFTASHGISFDNAAPNNSYTLFADNDNNNIFDPPPIDSIDQKFTLNGGFTISEFCAISYSGATQTLRCSGSDDSSGTQTIKTLNIMFHRPNPDAFIYAYDVNGKPVDTDPVSGNPLSYPVAYIRLKANDGTTRGIHVWTTGQISVDTLGQAIK